jgi:hypothetical protein
MITTRPTLRLACLMAVAVLALFAPQVAAQCPGPDGLSGPCCAPATANLPIFPPGTPSAMGICYANCGVVGTQNLRVDWSPPSPIACDQFVSQLTVSDSFGVPQLSGLLHLDYTRTWDEVDNAGNATQVWRFAVKADLSAVAGVPPSTCVTPTCVPPVGPYPTAFYYGYVDYANCDPTVPWDTVLVLYHACDRFIHAPGLSDKPGVFHPGRSYAIVAPHSTTQPFIPMNTKASQGTFVGEAMRNVASSIPPATVCTMEDRVAAGNITRLGVGCVCSLSTSPKQQSVREVLGSTTCINAVGTPGSFVSVDLGFPLFPWLHMISTSIGTWSSGSVYPGKESCWVDEGVFALDDACTGSFAEIMYGGSTKDGWTATLDSGITVDDFTDLANNYAAPLFGPYPGPFLGSVIPTHHLLYVNVP